MQYADDFFSYFCPCSSVLIIKFIHLFFVFTAAYLLNPIMNNGRNTVRTRAINSKQPDNFRNLPSAVQTKRKENNDNRFTPVNSRIVLFDAVINDR